MDIAKRNLIELYLDDMLTPDQLVELESWLQVSPVNLHWFTKELLLHDRLQAEIIAGAVVQSLPVIPSESQPPRPHGGSHWKSAWRPTVAILSLLLTSLIGTLIFWNGFVGTSASAASTELNLLMTANASMTARTYQIAVEDVALHAGKKRRNGPVDQRNRPPKPPMDDAVLHVRGTDHFVLIRTQSDGRKFLTGSDGRISWAIRPDGPVRTSRDLNRFSRDLPGHEHSMTFLNIGETLRQLQQAYDIRVLPEESDSYQVPAAAAERLLVAIRKRKAPGPDRVEISYESRTGEIRQIRLVEMPYGPERLTLRMTLLDRADFGASYFKHSQHHDADRVVLEE